MWSKSRKTREHKYSMLGRFEYLSLQAHQQYLEHTCSSLDIVAHEFENTKQGRKLTHIYSEWKLQCICKRESEPSQSMDEFLSQHTKLANWWHQLHQFSQLLNDITCSRRVNTTDSKKQCVPQRLIFSPWFPVESAVLIIMLCNFISLFLLKAQVWVDMAHHKLHRWYSTVSTALTE